MLVLLYTSLSCHQVVDRSLFRWLWDIVNIVFIVYQKDIVSMVIYCTTLNIVDGDCLP